MLNKYFVLINFSKFLFVTIEQEFINYSRMRESSMIISTNLTLQSIVFNGLMFIRGRNWNPSSTSDSWENN